MERLKRIVILVVAVGLIIVLVNFFMKWKSKMEVGDQVLGSIDDVGGQAVESGGSLIKKIVGDVPIDPQLKETLFSTDIEKVKPTELLNQQNINVAEEVQKLPAAGAKEVKKLIFKDFCEDIMQ